MHEMFGMRVSATNYDEIVRCCIACAKNGQPALVDFANVHVAGTARSDPQFARAIRAFDVVATDGQPLRWALNFFHKTRLTDRVYGPEATARLCKAAAEEGVSIYLYGSTNSVLADLKKNLLEKFPGLKIAGMESPPFRPLTEQEDRVITQRINDSGAGLVFIGIGAPKQEMFAYQHRDTIRGVQLCVGAAFDFHAGRKKIAPEWMQKRGLEWLYRLTQEPGRLWKRYLVNNSMYAWMCFTELFRRKSSVARETV